MPVRGTFGKQVLHRQPHQGPGARQPGIDARIGRDDFIEPQMMVLTRDVGQRVLLLGFVCPGSPIES